MQAAMGQVRVSMKTALYSSAPACTERPHFNFSSCAYGEAGDGLGWAEQLRVVLYNHVVYAF